MFELYHISFTQKKEYTNKIKILTYLCLFTVFIFFIIWFVRYSEPGKIYKSPKLVDPIQYRL